MGRPAQADSLRRRPLARRFLVLLQARRSALCRRLRAAWSKYDATPSHRRCTSPHGSVRACSSRPERGPRGIGSHLIATLYWLMPCENSEAPSQRRQPRFIGGAPMGRRHQASAQSPYLHGGRARQRWAEASRTPATDGASHEPGGQEGGREACTAPGAAVRADAMTATQAGPPRRAGG